MLLGKVAIDALNDYEKQRKEGKNPVFLVKILVLLKMNLISGKNMMFLTKLQCIWGQTILEIKQPISHWILLK